MSAIFQHLRETAVCAMCVTHVWWWLCQFHITSKKRLMKMATSIEDKIIELDGSTLEGGGQVVRFAVAVSAIMNKPVRIFNIRGGRASHGLSAQHLKGVQLVRDICNGQLTGACMGSTEITFIPGQLKAGSFTAEIGTAGSVALVIQIALPCLLFTNGESSLELKGGTDADFAPPIDFTSQVFNVIAERFGIKYDLEIVKRGFYPRGGGIVNAKIRPLDVLPIPPIIMTERGQLTQIIGRSFVAGTVNMSHTHLMAEEAIRILKKEHGSINIVIERVRESPKNVVGNSSGIILVAETSTGCRLAGYSIYKRNKTPEEIGADAAMKLIYNLNHGGCVDEHLQDQLILFMALAEGKSRIKSGPITSHTNTVISLAELFTKAKFSIVTDKENDSTSYIECDGHGFTK